MIDARLKKNTTTKKEQTEAILKKGNWNAEKDASDFLL